MIERKLGNDAVFLFLMVNWYSFVQTICYLTCNLYYWTIRSSRLGLEKIHLCILKLQIAGLCSILITGTRWSWHVTWKHDSNLWYINNSNAWHSRVLIIDLDWSLINMNKLKNQSLYEISTITTNINVLRFFKHAENTKWKH